MTAVARKVSGTQYLWTCHQIGVNNAGNNDSPQTNPADRSAIGWYKIQTAPSVMISDSGRIFDGTVSSPKFYYMPSLTVNKNGDMVIGFSGSSAAQYISAYYAGRLNNGTSLAGPVRYFTGKEYYLGVVGDFRWGDYSHTSLDTDGLTIWTIQEYAETRFSTSFNSAWGTWIGGITPF